jgi:hypothetical protein
MDTIETVMIATTPCAAAWRRRRAPRNRAGQVAGASGALGAAEGGRVADGLAAQVLRGRSNNIWQGCSIDIRFLRSANKSLSQAHVHLLLLLLISAFSCPGESVPAPYSCHPYSLLLSPYPLHPSTGTRHLYRFDTV